MQSATEGGRSPPGDLADHACTAVVTATIVVSPFISQISRCTASRRLQGGLIGLRLQALKHFRPVRFNGSGPGPRSILAGNPGPLFGAL